ncbi:MAG: hypothetical protein IPI55_02570 [Flavobacteriales bacterium]|nr:hypothetical protein [Flavobacteriales bacterium]
MKTPVLAITALLFSTLLSPSNAAAQCDTLNFEGITSGTDITNQFQACGVVFSSNGVLTAPQTYDYGIGAYTSVLHSYDWYGELRMDFVDPLNGTTHVPVGSVWFTNPVNSELDYIIAKAFDEGGVLLDSVYSVSPDTVELTSSGSLIAYVILDDDQGSAYVIDNVVIGGGSPDGVTELALPALAIIPALTIEMITVRTGTTERMELLVIASDGRVAAQQVVFAANATINVQHLAVGTYTVVCNGAGAQRTARFVKM